jgi:hypothetical protein
MKRLLVAVAFLCSVCVAHAQEAKKVVFVGYGQWQFLFSASIPALADRIKNETGAEVRGPMGWKEFGTETTDYYLKNPNTRIAAVGYSLSASMLQDICWKTQDKHRGWLSLGVAIDPTRQWAYATNAVIKDSSFHSVLRGPVDGQIEPTQSAPCFKRLVSFHNRGAWPFGGAVYIGSNVDYFRLPWAFHLTAQMLPEVWDTTVQAIKDMQ